VITLHPFDNKYLIDMLDLLERSDSTNRSVDTWHGNNMTAVMAFDDDKLIGVLPLEKRSFSLGKNRFLYMLWISGAHVESGYRSRGIGTAMDQKIREYFFPEYKAAFVYRGDETSPAYKWYKKLGYNELLAVLSFKKETKRPEATTEYVLLENEQNIKQWEDKLYNCFNCHSGSYGGFSKRHSQFWSDKIKTHYYKAFYDYSILVLNYQNEILGYAFLGRTSMKDGVQRIDILEFISPENSVKDSLYNAIMDFACRRNVNEVRIQLSVQDPNLQWVKSLGFVNRWRLNIMGKLIDPLNYMRDCLSEKIDLEIDCQFIIQTPSLGEHSIGTGKNTVKLFAHDSVLNEILLCRCNIANAVEEGRLIIVDGIDKNLYILEEQFPFNKWRYFQIDYI